MKAIWRLWVDCSTADNAHKLMNRFRKEIDVELNEVHVGADDKDQGYKISFYIQLEAQSWNDGVVEAIALGERVGYAWTLTGSILDGPNGEAAKFRIPGVVAATWNVEN